MPAPLPRDVSGAPPRDAAAPLPRHVSDALVRDADGALDRLREIMCRLRAPDGCPWDREQNFASIAPYTIEEAYEVADAIARGDMADLRDELGDLLLQVVYHAQMAEEAGLFSFDDVARGSADKMLRRHPHVFGDMAGVESAEAQAVNWEALKAAERAARGKDGAGEVRASALDGVAAGLPGLMRAAKLQARAARVGFDWPDPAQVVEKIAEEAGELLTAPDADAREDEFADLMFAMVNLGRHLKIDPETAMRRVNAKFERRFRAVEAALAAEGRAPGEATLAEMDALWDAAKAAERADAP